MEETITIDGVTGIAVVLMASFAIDRITTGVLFLLAFVKPWARIFPDPLSLESGPARLKAERKQKLIYFVVAAVLAIPLLAGYGQVRLFDKLGFQNVPWVLDIVATGLLLVGAADRVAGLLQMSGSTAQVKPEPRPIEITGRLTMESGPGKTSVDM